MKYLVVNDRIVGTAEGLTGEPPNGYSIAEFDQPNLIGWSITEGVLAEPAPFVDPQSYYQTETPLSFYNCELYKKARIKANKDSLLAMQVTIALVAEQRGDRVGCLGAVSAVRAIMRKSYGYVE